MSKTYHNCPYDRCPRCVAAANATDKQRRDEDNLKEFMDSPPPRVHDLSWKFVYDRARNVASQMAAWATKKRKKVIKVYGVPNGGVYAAMVASSFFDLGEHFKDSIRFQLVEELVDADLIVDDIVDSGRTRQRFKPDRFFALVDKTTMDPRYRRDWVTFPWERMMNASGPTDAVTRVIQFIGDDPMREGLRETPQRVVKSYGEIFAGYKQDPAEVLKVFEDGACDEMVVLKDIEFCSMCEHHMLPFVGVAHVGYIPNGRVIGVSKLARIVDIFARRLQIQERLTEQVTAALETHLQPKGVGCVIEAHHSCMSCRGVGKQRSTMVTSSLKGEFLDSEVRQEFLSFIRSR